MAATETFRRNARVAVQSSATTVDTQGGRTVAWTTVMTVWAQVVAQGSMPEYLAASRVAALAPYVVTLPYAAALAGIGPTWRLVWGDRTLDIDTVVDVDSKRQFWRLGCREVQA